MNTRLERFLKPKGSNPPTTQVEPSEHKEPLEAPKSLHEIFRAYGKASWLTQNNPALRSSFNIFNKSLHPDRPLAKGVTTICLKGTTFEDKRENCLALTTALTNLKANGEIQLVHEPSNPYDPNALAAVDEHNKIVGYIPKAKELNKTYLDAIQASRFCGAYIVDAKISNFQGKETAILNLAIGWK